MEVVDIGSASEYPLNCIAFKLKFYTLVNQVNDMIKKKYLSYSLCVLSNIIILCSTPYITPYLVPHYQAIIGIGLLVLFYFVKKYISNYTFDRWNRIVLLCIILSFLHGLWTYLFYFAENGMEGYRNTIGFILKYGLLFPVGVLIRKEYRFFLGVIWYTNLAIIALSIILFLLCLNGIYLPYIEFFPDGREHYFFYIGATNAIFEFGKFIFIRIAGFCDEPGRLALVVIYLLVLNEFTYKNNNCRYFFTFSGILTFSAAFFITYIPIVIYWILIGLCNFRKILLTTVFISIGCVVGSNIKVDVELEESINDAVELLVVNRFEQDRTGKFNGDNRSASIEKQLQGFYYNPIVGVLGKGGNPQNKYKLSDPTFFSNLARYGIFDLFFYAPFFYLFILYVNKKEFWLFAAIGLNFLQRPELEHMFFLVVLTLIYYRKYNYLTYEKNSSIGNLS